MTNRECISNIRSTHRLLDSDNVINDRTILSEARSALIYLLKQQTDKRRLYSSPNIFTTLPCLKMEQAPIAECCDFTSPILISRTVEKVPKIAEAVYGLLVQQVAGPDNMTQFIY